MIQLVSPLPETVYTELHDYYTQSFPPSEQRPWALILHPQDPAFTCYGILLSKQDWAGLITVWSFDTFLYIEHLVVAPDLRNQQIGRQVLEYLQHQTDKPIILEAEPADANDFAPRRLSFYARMGFVPQPFGYAQPPYTDQGEWVPMHLLSNTPLSPELFEQIKRTLYQRVYLQP